MTLGLSVAGAFFGATAGVVALAVMLSLFGGLTRFDLWLLEFSGLVGAALGAFCTPVATWCLLRRVPLGRMFVALTVGTILGGLLGSFLPVLFFFPVPRAVVQPIATAVAGFLTTAIILRKRYASA